MRKKLIDVLTYLPLVYRVPVLLRDIQGSVDRRGERRAARQTADAESRLHRGRLILRRYPRRFRWRDSQCTTASPSTDGRVDSTDDPEALSQAVVERRPLVTAECRLEHLPHPSHARTSPVPRRRPFGPRARSSRPTKHVKRRLEPKAAASATRAAALASAYGAGGHSAASREETEAIWCGASVAASGW